MSLKYYESSLSIRKSPSETYRNDLQAFVNSDFENASNYYVIEEELNKGTKVYTSTGVRLIHITDSGTTGRNIANDWKELLFKDFEHARAIGTRYRFDNNIWITVNLETYKTTTASCTVRRCNNNVKWYDENGALQQEPCIIDYAFTQYDNKDSKIVLPDGNIKVVCQYNDNTSKITQNQRFIFGGQAFKVQGRVNFLNTNTFGGNPPILELIMYKDQESDFDDLINNIADANKYVYTVDINEMISEQEVGFSGALTTTVKLNGSIVNESVLWTSSDTDIATIDNDTGLFTLLSTGTVTLTATLVGNIVSDSITINVVEIVTPDVVNIISPNVTKILLGKTQTYSVDSMYNGVVGLDTFTITSSGSPSDCYILNIIDGNTFSVTNKKMTTIPLVIQCVNNTNASSVSITIKLASIV